MTRVFVAEPESPLGKRACDRLRRNGHHVRGAGRVPVTDRETDILDWPTSTDDWSRLLSNVDVVLIAGPVDGSVAPDETLSALIETIAAADREKIRRLVLVGSALVYDPDTLATQTATVDTPLAIRADASPEAAAWLETEDCLARAVGIAERVILRSDRAFGSDIAASRALVHDAWQSHRPTWSGDRLQGVDADDLADMMVRACTATNAPGKAINVAGPVAVSTQAAVAEIERLHNVLTDGSLFGAPWRPQYQTMPPVLSVAETAAILGDRPRRPIWHSLAGIIQAVVAEERIKLGLPSRRPGLPSCLAAIRDGSRPLSGRAVVVTEASAAVGAEVIRILRRLGADVVAIASTAEESVPDPPGGQREGALEVIATDLSRIAGIRSAAEAIIARHTQLSGLIVIPASPFEARQEADPDIERNFARGTLAPCMLVELLGPALFAAPSARVVNVIDAVHADHPLDLTDLQGRVTYEPVANFGQAQSGLFLLSLLFAERAAGSRVRVLTVLPSPSKTEPWRLSLVVPDAPDLAHEERRRRALQRNVIAQQLADPSIAAAQIVDAMIAEGPAYENGRFLKFGHPAMIPAQIDDRRTAEHLWNECRHLAAATSPGLPDIP